MDSTDTETNSSLFNCSDFFDFNFKDYLRLSLFALSLLFFKESLLSDIELLFRMTDDELLAALLKEWC